MMVYSAVTKLPVVVVVEIGQNSIIVISRRHKQNTKFPLYNRCMPYEIRANLVGILAIFSKTSEGKWTQKEGEMINFYNDETKEQVAIPYTVGSCI